jgi:hypothetical protein
LARCCGGTGNLNLNFKLGHYNTIINLNIKKQTQLKTEQTELNRSTELLTLYNNKNQHQELRRIKMKQTELK